MRGFLAPIVVQALYRKNATVATLITVLASITDMLDGWIARRYHVVTVWGKILDPLMDKIFIMALFFGLAKNDYVPAWVAWVIVGRELLMTFMGSILWISKKPIPEAGMIGKFNTCLQLLLAVGVLLSWSFHPIIQSMMMVSLVLATGYYTVCAYMNIF